MFLKKVSLFGFKSFGKKEELNFASGINAIVGPNGCGKSNILEAIRWVLGEQRVNILRGKSMADVIFSGCNSYKPLSVAEASLYLSNESHVFPIDFEEVVVSRRVFRSGESEYFINDGKCRLKDIQELFAGTGLGKNTFSIIEQGKIESIISNQAQDRRLIFEEIAGISKYKMRKQEALKKLENTNFNILRIDDVLYELQKQTNSLEREVKRANQYRKLSEEINTLEVEYKKNQYIKLYQKYENICKEYLKVEENEANISKILEKYTESLKEKYREIKEVRNDLSVVSSELSSLNQEKQDIEDRTIRSEEKKNYLTSQTKQVQNETEELKNKENYLEKCIKNAKTDTLSLNQEIEKTNSELLLKETALCQIEKDKEAAENILNKEKEEIIDIQKDISRINNEITNNEVLGKNLDSQIVKLDKEESKVNLVLNQTCKDYQKTNNKFGENKNKIDNLQKMLKIDEKELCEKKDHLQEIKLSIAKYQENFNKSEIKYHTLKKLQDDFVGYFTGVKTILEACQKNDKPFGEICQIVSDLIKVSPEYELTIEVALGSNIQSIVVLTAKDAQAAIAYLKKNKGKATFLPLDLIKERNVCDKLLQVIGWEGVIGKGKDLVLFDPLYQKIFDYLLGNVLIVENIVVAERIIRQIDLNIKLVTLSGEAINPFGVITGGQQKSKEFRFLSRRRNIETAKVDMKKASEKITELRKEETSISNYLISITKRIQEKKEEIAQIEKTQRNFEYNIKAQQIKIKDCEAIIKLCQSDRSRYKEEKFIVERNLKRLKSKKKLQEEYDQKRRSIINSLNLDLQIYQENVKNFLEKITNLKVILARFKERERNQVNSLNRFCEDLKEAQEKEYKLRQKLHNLKTETTVEEDIQESLAKNIGELKEKSEKISRKLKELEEKYALKENCIAKEQEIIDNKQHEKDEVVKMFYQVKLEKSNLENSLNKIRENLLEIGFRDLFDEKNSLIIKSQIVEEDANEEYEEKIALLKSKRENFKEVNLNAPKEYQELKERIEFVSNQKKDLASACKHLHAMIEKIDLKCKDLFLETFLSIKTNFSQIFNRLFEGGFAQILLTDDNLLIAGVDIIVQPKGKKLTNISLLSGGEKSLVAIALLFSILMIKPVPFCVLDEIDAALDEVNVARYVKILSEFGQRMQFLIITHNKKAIEIADTLYGITMQEAGISKVVSVNLKEAIS
ncbi:MAG: chromosome segregation protein SMC [bacterium]|nr:chromosome segregation protein SMC [bacterium]